MWDFGQVVEASGTGEHGVYVRRGRLCSLFGLRIEIRVNGICPASLSGVKSTELLGRV